MKSKNYKKGVYCPKCYKYRTVKQRHRSESRQNQINLADTKKIKHLFKKTFIKDI